MTVSDLIRLLSDVPGDAEVVVEMPSMEYVLVTGMNPPCGDEDRAERGVALLCGEYV